MKETWAITLIDKSGNFRDFSVSDKLTVGDRFQGAELLELVWQDSVELMATFLVEKLP